MEKIVRITKNGKEVWTGVATHIGNRFDGLKGLCLTGVSQRQQFDIYNDICAQITNKKTSGQSFGFDWAFV